jgi:hypothetical protein
VASGKKINSMGRIQRGGEGGEEKNKFGSQDIRSLLMAAQMAAPKRQRDQWADSPGSEDQMAKRVVTNNTQTRRAWRTRNISRRRWRNTISTRRRSGRRS